MNELWTEKEIEILKNNYNNKPKQELLSLLQNKTWDAIKLKASRLKLTYYRQTSKNRFWKKVDKKSDSECWNWTTTCSNNGYGQIWIEGKTIAAHRFSWELHFGEIPNDKPLVLHHCDNPK